MPTPPRRRTEAGLSVVDGTSNELPGHANDARSLPNLPFSVDPNRVSDGVSSVSPLTSTAPSFPLYKGAAVHDPSGRKDAESATDLSRNSQGIAKKGAGEFEKDKARLARLVEAAGGLAAIAGDVPFNVTSGKWTGPVPDPSVLPSATFTVDSTVRWNPSAFAIQQGETYVVTVPAAAEWMDSTGQKDFPSITTTTLGYDGKWDVRKKCYTAEGQCR